MDGKDLRETCTDGKARIKRLLRILRDKLDAAPKRVHLHTREGPDTAPVPTNRTAVGRDQPEQNTHQGTLARAALSLKADGTPLRDGETAPIEHPHRTSACTVPHDLRHALRSKHSRCMLCGSR